MFVVQYISTKHYENPPMSEFFETKREACHKADLFVQREAEVLDTPWLFNTVTVYPFQEEWYFEENNRWSLSAVVFEIEEGHLC